MTTSPDETNDGRPDGSFADELVTELVVTSSTTMPVHARLPPSAITRLVGSASLAVGTGVVLAVTANLALAILAGIAVFETLFVVSGWIVLWPLSASATRVNARREARPPIVEPSAVLAAALGRLVSIVMLLAQRPDTGHAAIAPPESPWPGQRCT